MLMPRIDVFDFTNVLFWINLDEKYFLMHKKKYGDTMLRNCSKVVFSYGMLSRPTILGGARQQLTR